MSYAIVGSGTVGSMTLGVYPRALRVMVGRFNSATLFYGVQDLTRFVEPDWQIENVLGQPSRFTCNLIGDIEPVPGARIYVTVTSPRAPSGSPLSADWGDVLFVGNALSISTELRQIGQRPMYRIEAQDLSWELNRLGYVSGTYGSIGYNTLVRQLVENYYAFTGSYRPFKVGYVSQSLGNAPLLTFDKLTLVEALQRVAESADAYLSIEAGVNPDVGRINIFREGDHLTQADSITNTSRNALNIRTKLDYTTLTTVVRMVGAQVRLTEASSGGQIYVADAEPFRQMVNPLVYTANSFFSVTTIVDQPVGALLTLSLGNSLVTPLNTAVNQAAVALAPNFGEVSSLVAQMTYGSNRSFYMETNTSLSGATLEQRAVTLATRLGKGYQELSFAADDERHNLGRQLRPGQRVAIAITSPVAITENKTLMIQQVTIQQIGTVANSTVDIRRTASARLQDRNETLDDVLTQRKTGD